MKEGTAIIIVGVNRGGTSSVAASLNALDIFIGDEWKLPVYEDLRLSRSFQKRNWKAFEEIVASYEKRHEVFGWKYPPVTERLGKIDKVFKKPKYIFVFRDIFSIANRLNHARHISLISGMFFACYKYFRILLFIWRAKPDCLFVSYEKMLLDTEGYASQLLDFLGLDKSEANIDSIKKVVSPSPAIYQQWSDRTRNKIGLKKAGFAGRVDALDSFKVEGSVRSLASNKPVSLEIFVNGQRIGETVARSYKESSDDIKASQNHSYGFLYHFDEPLKLGDEVSVQPLNSNADLNQSPQIIE